MDFNKFGLILEGYNNFADFGFEITKPDKQKLQSVDLPENIGTGIIEPTGEFGYNTYYPNLFSLSSDELELLKTYRELANNHEVDDVITEIVNEALVFNVRGEKAIDISFFESEEINEKIKNIIIDEFNNIYNILEFSEKGADLFKSWLVDGRLFLQKIVDSTNIKNGIVKIIPINSLKINKITEIEKPDENGIFDLSKMKVYYIYSDIYNVFDEKTNLHLDRYFKISGDTIAYIDSGIYDAKKGFPLSFLWKMIVPYNNMKLMEESMMIYRVIRSPERRVFYINVGGLSKIKAEAYVKDLMMRFQNKFLYDPKTGNLVDRKNVLSMMEDLWIPRRDDGKGTQIDTLPGASNLGTIDDVKYFKDKFLDASGVPKSRLVEDTVFIFGRTNETTRKEFKFKKIVDNLRNRFASLFYDLLKTQLLLKNIITEPDWNTIKKYTYLTFTDDSVLNNWRDMDLLETKAGLLQSLDLFVGKYYDDRWILQNVLKCDDVKCDELLTAAENYTEKQQMQQAQMQQAIENQQNNPDQNNQENTINKS